MSTPFETEEADQGQDSLAPRDNPWQRSPEPHLYSGIGPSEDNAYLGPFYHLAAATGTAMEKGVHILAGLGRYATAPLADFTFNNQLPGAEAAHAADKYLFDSQADARAQIKLMAPDPAKVGIAMQLLHGFAEQATSAILGGVAGKALGVAATGTEIAGASTFGSFAGVEAPEDSYEAARLKEQGLSSGTAEGMGAVHGALAGLGVSAPMVFGSSLMTRLMTGAGVNVAFGTVGAASDYEALKAGGYNEMADQVKVLDGTRITTDAILGLGFGGLAHLGHLSEERQEAIRQFQQEVAAHPEIRDAALLMNLALRDNGKAPGAPVDPGAANAHELARETALDQLQRGEHVDVSGTGVDEATFVSRGGEEDPAAKQMLLRTMDESGLFEEADKADQLEEILAAKLEGREPRQLEPRAPLVDPLDLKDFGLPEAPKTLPGDHELLRPHWDDDIPEHQDTSPEREQLRSDLIDERFDGKQPVKPGEKPIAIVMGGGGASGKGTIIKALRKLGEIPENAVHLDSDEFKTGVRQGGKFVMNGLPEYHQIVGHGDGRAALTTHKESSELFKRARIRGMGGTDGAGPRYHLLLDRTLGNPEKGVRELQALKDAGYEVRLVGVTVHPEDAIARAVERAKGPDKRYVPLDQLLLAHKGFSQGFERYAAIADTAELFDNNVAKGQPAVSIAQRAGKGKELEVIHTSAYTAFAKKGELNEKASTIRQISQPAGEAAGASEGNDRVLSGDVGEGAAGTGRVRGGEREPGAAGVAGGRLETVTTAAGRRIQVAHRIVEAADLVTSDRAEYPQEIQPRQRGERQALDTQVREIAKDLEPERLGSSPEADRGAPIVSANNEVESGNGRVMALRQVYEGNPEKAEAYKAFLESQGHDISGFKQPVLVRERLTNLTQEDRQAFAVEANQSATAAASAVERGAADARRLNGALLANLMPGDIDNRANQPFVDAFMAGVPIAEQNGLLGSDGRSLSQEGVRRIQAAVLSKAYGGALRSNDLLARMLESTDAEQRNILGALLDSAPAFAKLRQMVSDGEIPAALDITPSVLRAVEEAAAIRESGQSLKEHIGQADMMNPRDPMVDQILRSFYDKGGKRAAGRAKVKEALADYVDRATAQRLEQGALFNDPPATAEQLMEQALEGRAAEDMAPKPGADMFGAKTKPLTRENPLDPSADMAKQALEATPNLEISRDDGLTVRAAAAVLADNEALERGESVLPGVIKAATDCAARLGPE